MLPSTADTIPTGERDIRCKSCGPLDTVEAREYTSVDGKPSLHLRAACPRCGSWVLINNSGPWWVPRSLLGLGTRVGFYKGALSS